MSSHMLTEWMAYYQIEPFGDELLDIHLANITAVLRNANRGSSEQAIEPQKFRLWKEIRQFDPQDFFNRLKETLGK